MNEATAFTDPENEERIQESIAALTKGKLPSGIPGCQSLSPEKRGHSAGQGKTLLVIAHRLSTIKNADNIVVLKNGSVLAEGSQEELLKNCPFYENMWKAHIGAKEWAVSVSEKEAQANV